MPTSTVVPTAAAYTTGTGAATNVGGAGSLQAALADASDATYGQLTASTSVYAVAQYGVEFGNPGLPDGAGLTSVNIKFRGRYQGSVNVGAVPPTGTVGVSVVMAQNSLSESIASGIGNSSAALPSGASFGDVSVGGTGGSNFLEAGKQASDITKVSALGIQWYAPQAASGSVTADVSKLSAEVNYVRAPTPTSLGVTGQTTTTKPTLAWTKTDPDAQGQYAHQAVVWLVSDQGNFPGGQAAMQANPDYLFGLTPTGAQPTPPSGVSAIGSDAQGPYFVVSGTTYRAKAWTKDAVSGLPGWKLTSTASWSTDQDMPLTGAHKAYTRLASLHQGQLLFPRGTVPSATFTMAVTPPNAATSITPVWQYPSATAPNNTMDYRMKLSVVMPSDTVSRKVRVERQVAGTGKWAYLPAGSIVTQGTGATTLTFYDTAASPNKSMQYRVTTGLTTAEAWGTPVTSSNVTAVFDQFVLRDPLFIDGPAVILYVQGDLESEAGEVVGFSRGLGATLPTAVSDAITAETIPMEVLTTTEADYQLLRTLRARRYTLLLQGDMAGWYRWVRFGEDWGETLIRQSLRRVEATRARRVKFTLVETWPVAGQPMPADWGV